MARLLLADARAHPGEYNLIREIAREGKAWYVRLLLARRDVDPADDRNRAIYDATDPETVALLFADARVNPADRGNRALVDAAQAGQSEKVRLLLAYDGVHRDLVDPMAQNGSAFETRSVEVLKMLLEDPRSNPGFRNNHAFMWAVKRTLLKNIAELLKCARVDPSDRDNRAVEFAIEHNKLDLLNVLLADARVSPVHKLHAAVRDDSSPVVRAVVDWHIARGLVDLLPPLLAQHVRWSELRSAWCGIVFEGVRQRERQRERESAGAGAGGGGFSVPIRKRQRGGK
jgi:hypothetical protein